MTMTRFSVTLLVAVTLSLPGLVAGQATSPNAARPDGATSKADLGIGSMRCRCSSQTRDDSTTWSFLTEPEILAVRPDGPSAGKLAAGDRVVAIDGSLITTPEGGRRWSRLRPGDEIKLRVRRDGTTRTVSMVVGARSAPNETTAGGDLDDLDLHLVLPKLPRLLPTGWLGIGVSCDCTVDTSSGAPLWEFRSPPEIAGVASGSPADGAGLRTGDVLLRIDGRPLDTPAGGASFSAIQPDQRVRFDVRRDGAELTVGLVAVAREDTAPADASPDEEARPEGGR